MTQLKDKSMARIARHMMELNEDIDSGVKQCQCGECEIQGKTAKRIINAVQANALEIMEDKETYQVCTETLSPIAHGIDAWVCIMLEPFLTEKAECATKLEGMDRMRSYAQMKRLSQYLTMLAQDIDRDAEKIVPKDVLTRAQDITDVIKEAMKKAGISTDDIKFDIGINREKRPPRKRKPPLAD